MCFKSFVKVVKVDDGVMGKQEEEEEEDEENHVLPGDEEDGSRG